MIYLSLILLNILVIFMAIFLIINNKRFKILQEKLKQKKKNIDSLYNDINMLTEEKYNLIDRIRDLEDIKGDAFQVKLRNDIVEVKIDFTKLEMVTIYAGVSILLERTKNPEDAKIYVALIEKINSFLGDMREKGEGPFG